MSADRFFVANNLNIGALDGREASIYVPVFLLVNLLSGGCRGFANSRALQPDLKFTQDL